MCKTLVIGIGNTGRADDGVGWAFVDKLALDDRFEVVHRYQLQVEDAELISGYDNVWFVDASHEHYQGGFQCVKLKPEKLYSYTSHELHPATVLNLCDDLYEHTPKARLLGISGDHWELGHGMSRTVHERMERALSYFFSNVGRPDEDQGFIS
jgi:hydrogenase maturation protease